MTLVKFKNRPVETHFNSFVNEFFEGFPSLLKDGTGSVPGRYTTPVNITENEAGYELQMLTPGFAKEDIAISLEKRLLTISADKKAEEENKNEKQLRKEFSLGGFKRSFTIDEKIEAEKIEAKYANGVLTLNFPKKAEVKPATKQITIG